MHAFIGPKLLSDKLAQPGGKPFEIYDDRLQGFTLRIQPTGTRSYYARLGRNYRVALGRVDVLPPEEAREKCQIVLGNVANGRHPLHGLLGIEGLTLGQFIDETYAPSAKATRPRTANNTLEKLNRVYGSWFGDPLSSITVERIERMKIRRLNAGRSPKTVLRDIFALSGVLTRAVRLGKMTSNPVRGEEKPRIDRRPRVRFLNDDEETRLRDALRARDAEMCELQASRNRRRTERQKELLRPLPHFGDHLTPAVILSMNTGMRRGEILALRWKYIDFDRQLLTVEGSTAKTRQTRHVFLNEEAMTVLSQWREQSLDGELVFPMHTGFRTAWKSLLRRAEIEQFRWHDLRHHFASSLVQIGVPLNTVRDLLGHASVAMSLRYAHLAPDQRREAGTRLAAKRTRTVTQHLQWDFDPNTQPRTD